MRSIVFGAAILLAGTPALAVEAPAAAPASAKEAGATSKAKVAAKKKDDFDLAQMMAIFDKIFPPQPDPLPARLALSRTSVNGLFPDGTYARMMTTMMHGIADRVMSMSEADFAKPGSKPKSGDTLTLRQQMAKDDPYFEERMKITEQVVGEELTKITAIIEPKIRDGLARSMARRFDEKQLTDINAFLATDSGREFGRQSMAMWVDPDVFRSMITSVPDLMTAMPDVMQKVEAATAHLPKPKKSSSSPPKKK